jgi:hypothetical protein
MNRRGWALALVSVTVVVLFLAFILNGGIAQDPQGFRSSDLVTPNFTMSSWETSEAPGPLGVANYGMQLATEFTYAPVYDEYGSVIEVTLKNRGPNQIFAWAYGLRWEGETEVQWRNCSVLVPSGGQEELGLLYFRGPGETGQVSFDILLKAWSSSINGDLWDDKGEVLLGSVEVDVLEEEVLEERQMTANTVGYYNKLNQLVDFQAVTGMAQAIGNATVEDYDLLQVIMAYELVKEEVEYLEDTDDHWQSAEETLTLGTGDCEDHSILMASLVTALGGNARINLIPGHAFPTVFVGNDTSDLAQAVLCVRSYYDQELPVFWLLDDLGYWMVMDTVGMPYAGGFPANCLPTGPDGGEHWNINGEDWVITVDVTGDPVPGIVL